MSSSPGDDLPAQLTNLAWTLHRMLRQSSEPPSGAATRSHAQVELLRLVGSLPGVTVRETAEILKMQPSNVSALVTRLAGEGLLERRPDTRDRRVVRLHPTPEMHALRDEFAATQNKAVADALDRLPAEARQRIEAAMPDLLRLAVNLGARG